MIATAPYQRGALEYAEDTRHIASYGHGGPL